MKRIEKLETKISILRGKLSHSSDPDQRAELEEEIDRVQDDIDELEEAIRDEQDYEEATGTTPQDLYNERNSYAIAQGEMIDRFRNEY